MITSVFSSRGISGDRSASIGGSETGWMTAGGDVVTGTLEMLEGVGVGVAGSRVDGGANGMPRLDIRAVGVATAKTASSIDADSLGANGVPF